MTRLQLPFTEMTRVRPCEPGGAPGPDLFRCTAAGPGQYLAPGEFFLGLRHADPRVDAKRGFQFFGRVWRDAEGRWWGARTGWSGSPDPIALVITGLADNSDSPAAAAAPAARPAPAAVPVALPDAVLHASQRAPKKRRAAAPSPDVPDLFAGAP